MRIHVIGVDPGKMCGIAAFSFIHGASDFASWSLPRDDAVKVLRESISLRNIAAHDHVYVGCERYTIGQRTVKLSRQPDALEVIGIVRQLSEDVGASFDLHDVASAKKIGNPTVLKSLGWWLTGRDADHANDAAAHVLLTIAQRVPLVFKQLIRKIQ